LIYSKSNLEVFEPPLFAYPGVISMDNLQGWVQFLGRPL